MPNCDPVGIPEIAKRLAVERKTVDKWRVRGILPAPSWTVGGRPAWNWSDILWWAVDTGRMERPTTAGRRKKASAGGFAYGSPPMGFTSVDGVLAEDRAEQLAIRRMSELWAEGLSYRAITEVLNAEGITAKRGGEWHPTTVWRTMRRLELP